MTHRLLAWATALGIAAASPPAGATVVACLEGFRAVTLALDPLASKVTAPGDPGVPEFLLAGRIRVEVGTLPLSGATPFEIVQVDVTGGSGGSARLDPDVASAGLGVLASDQSFLVPTLFLRVSQGGETHDLAVANVTGSIEVDPLCGNTVTGLTSSFEVGPPDMAPGTYAVTVVAAPEPGGAALGAAAALALALCRRAKGGAR
jgi:hypothetical protein